MRRFGKISKKGTTLLLKWAQEKGCAKQQQQAILRRTTRTNEAIAFLRIQYRSEAIDYRENLPLSLEEPASGNNQRSPGLAIQDPGTQRTRRHGQRHHSPVGEK